jgi:streptomycin 6-kinase
MNDLLEHYLRLWNLRDPSPLATTLTSHLYLVNVGGLPCVLKLLTEQGYEERIGAVALQYFDGRAAVRLLAVAADAQLLEYAEGEDLVALVERGEDTRATEIIADVLTHLHVTPTQAPPQGLVPLRTWFHSLFRQAESDPQEDGTTLFQRGAIIADALLADPREMRVLHGDIHHGNIRHKQGRGWLAFDPKGLYGERTYDAANTLCNPISLPDHVEDSARLLSTAELLARELKLDFRRLLAYTFAYTCLSAAWSLEVGISPQHAQKMAEIIEPHLNAKVF